MPLGLLPRTRLRIALDVPGCWMRTASLAPMEKPLQLTMAEVVPCRITMLPALGRPTDTCPATTCSPVGKAQTGAPEANASATASATELGCG